MCDLQCATSRDVQSSLRVNLAPQHLLMRILEFSSFIPVVCQRQRENNRRRKRHTDHYSCCYLTSQLTGFLLKHTINAVKATLSKMRSTLFCLSLNFKDDVCCVKCVMSGRRDYDGTQLMNHRTRWTESGMANTLKVCAKRDVSMHHYCLSLLVDFTMSSVPSAT